MPEFLAKQLLKHFGFPAHYAPGEAEAECALLQREGIVDAVLSEDVDTLMFGSAMTLRSWTPEQKSSKTPTHVNVYEAAKTKESSGLDRNGMILIAMMSGGDYITEGIPGCGPKLACEAARAGFGDDLCKLDRKDVAGMDAWRERLRHEIRTNESKHFRQKRPTLTIPDTFPNKQVLSYYTHPCISGPDKIAKLKDTLKWDMPLDYPSLREFTGDAFDWRCIGGAKKFIRNLAPAVLVRELRLRGEAADDRNETISTREEIEASLINTIHGKRLHPTTDNTPELRISFTPIELVSIDLSIEPPDEEITEEGDESGSEPLPTEDGECPASPKKTRGPSTYDPMVHEKIWLLDTFVRLGAPLKVQDYEAAAGAPKAKAAPGPRKPALAKPANAKTAAGKKAGGMEKGALDRFTKTVKPGVNRLVPTKSKSPEFDELDLSGIDALAKERSKEPSAKATSQAQSSRLRMPISEVDLSSGPNNKVSIQEVDLSFESTNPKKRSSKRPSPEPVSPERRARPRIASPPRKTSRPPEVVDLLSSPVKPAPPIKPRTRVSEMRDHFKQFSKAANLSPQNDADADVPLPDTVTRRRKRSSLRRYQTAPTAGLDDLGSPTLRPSTPRGFDIEAIDLASPDSLPSLPRFDTLHKLSDEMRQSVTASSMEPPSFKLAGRRSASPAALEPLQARSGMEFILLSSSLPTPPLEVENHKLEEAFERPTISAAALLPVNKRLRDRKVDTALVMSTVKSTSSVTESSTVSSTTVLQTQASRSVQAVTIAAAEPPMPKQVNKITKRFIQPRESLPGGWKEVELEIDLTAPTPKNRRMYRKSGVEELDLTGD